MTPFCTIRYRMAIGLLVTNAYPQHTTKSDAERGFDQLKTSMFIIVNSFAMSRREPSLFRQLSNISTGGIIAGISDSSFRHPDLGNNVDRGYHLT
ncbi:hypothetical protein N9R09_02050 [Porticoccaceae bacterium]|nr:hypothetical protein [Porticoccaceae bacterium]